MVYPYSDTGMVITSPTSIAKTLDLKLVFLHIFITFVVCMCKYTTKNLYYNTFLEKCWRNVILWILQIKSMRWINAIRKHFRQVKCILDTNDGAIIIQVFPTEDEEIIECRSINPAYPPFRVKRDLINGWYRVLMCLSLK